MCRTLGPCFFLWTAYSYHMDALPGSKMKLYTLFGAWVEGGRDMLAVFAEYNNMVIFIQHESKKRTYKGGSLGYDSLVYIESELGKLCNNEEIEI